MKRPRVENLKLVVEMRKRVFNFNRKKRTRVKNLQLITKN